MWYLWLAVGLCALIMFIKRYDGSRRSAESDSSWIGDVLSGFDSDGDSGCDGGGD